MSISFIDLMNKLAKELPEGYIVEISVENGAGWVNLLDHDDNLIELNFADTDMLEDVLLALEKAKELGGK